MNFRWPNGRGLRETPFWMTGRRTIDKYIYLERSIDIRIVRYGRTATTPYPGLVQGKRPFESGFKMAARARTA